MGGEYKAMHALYWAPRICGGAFLLFTIWTAIAAAAVHLNAISSWQEIVLLLAPSYLMAGALALACRLEWAGGAVFVALGVSVWLMPSLVPTLQWAHFGWALSTGLLFLGAFALSRRFYRQSAAGR